MFNDDLDGYHRWLQERQQPLKPTNEPVSGKADRKAEKREAAERRKRLKPLKDAVERHEREVQKNETKLAELNAQLGDSSLYEDANKPRLQELLQQQARTQQALQQAEEDWMAAEEALQQAEAEDEH